MIIIITLFLHGWILQLVLGPPQHALKTCTESSERSC